MKQETKKHYQKPVVELILVNSRDIICTSTAEPDEPNSSVDGTSIDKITDGGILD